MTEALNVADGVAPPSTPSGANWTEPDRAQPMWTYTESDPALMLFTAALSRFNLRFPMGCAILELGCAETNWLERMAAWDKSFRLTGVDVNAHHRHPEQTPGVSIVRGDASNPDLFEPETFDWVVLLGALEHFGLGWYKEPKRPDGDTATMANIGRWLRPGGFVYFDVPCQPTYEETAHFRSYAPSQIQERLLAETGLQEVNRGYSLSEPHAGTWCHEPTVRRYPYWFVAVLAQKVAA